MIPTREALRAAYATAIQELPNSQQLTTLWYAEVSARSFDAYYGALEDAQAASENPSHHPPRQRVIAAPVGSGKTSSCQAFIVAFTRLADADPSLSGGCVLVVKERQAADNLYRRLRERLPGRVGVWTKDHDAKHITPPEKRTVKDPAARLHKHELPDYPVVIVTHAFFQKGTDRQFAKNYVGPDGSLSPRLLTVIDEQPDDVDIYDVTLKDVMNVWELVKSDARQGALISPMLEPFALLLTNKALSSGSGLEKPSDDRGGWEAATANLSWFRAMREIG
jgi:hypothetical protein